MGISKLETDVVNVAKKIKEGIEDAGEDAVKLPLGLLLCNFSDNSKDSRSLSSENLAIRQTDILFPPSHIAVMRFAVLNHYFSMLVTCASHVPSFRWVMALPDSRKNVSTTFLARSV